MDRRKSIKTILVGSVSAGAVLESCKQEVNQGTEQQAVTVAAPAADRMPEEIALDRKLQAEHFFTEHELATIGVLADIIIPLDEISGNATDAKVPEFIEFIVKDMPEHQTPMRGGLRWLDLHALHRFGQDFRSISNPQQIQIVEDIAYPEKAKPEFLQGVAFFNLMRNLTMSGFYSTEMGWKDLGYMGNKPNQWNGIPQEVLNQYKLSYSPKELKECISFP